MAKSASSNPEMRGRSEPRKKRRWGVLISGRGSNLSALIDARDEIDLRIVVSSNPTAYGLLRAKRAGLLTAVAPTGIAQKTGKPKTDWVALTELLRSHGVTHVVLAGFMKIVPASFVADWQNRIVNLHPSLLPAYPGLESIERAYKDRNDIGITVHEVNEAVDAGRVICQRRSLNQQATRAYSFATAEFFVHVDEQRVLKEVVAKWRESDDMSDSSGGDQ